MREFTKEEKSLCRQIAERHEKPLENFDLVIGTHLSGEEFVGYFHKELTKEKLMKARLDEVMVGFCETAKTTKPMIPILTISDCLEFLRGRNYDCILYSNQSQLRWYLKFNIYPLVNSMEILNGGKTPLEVCLKAVLAVLGEK